jgi:hypothetical protein
LKRFDIGRMAVFGVLVALTMPVTGGAQTIAAKGASIMGTVTDVNGDTVGSAAVVLKGPDSHDGQTFVTSQSGFFEFHGVTPGLPYRITITSSDFEPWVSPPITLDPGQFKIMTNVQLRIATQHTAIDVKYDSVEVATQQFKAEEKQRVFGFIPNFYVSYDHDPEPLTAKMKFELALKVSADPVTAGGILLVASAKQAGNSPHFGQGWGPYGERVGAISADGFSDILIGGAILPSLLHQDPRYFYQGTGATSSRIRHAIFSPFVAKSDSGKWEPNYSSMGGDLASSGLANLYYPNSNRGAGLVFGNFALGTAERVGASLAQEFLIGKFTRRGGHMK